jgi:glycine/D-amino acid oxidase-like deaminating enzyme
MQKQLKVAIIGGGISGLLVAKRLLDLEKNSQVLGGRGLNITLFDASRIYPSCSRSSTSTISRHGVQKGFSELGDIILESYKATESFLAKNSHLQGWERGIQRELFFTDDHQRETLFHQRFSSSQQNFGRAKERPWGHKKEMHWCEGEAIFFHAQEFLNSLKNELISSSFFQLKNQRVQKLTFDGTGAYESLLFQEAPPLKKVPGLALEFDNFNYRSGPLRIQCQGGYLTYHQKAKKLYIGPASYENDFFFLGQNQLLKEYYELFSTLLGDKLPDFERGKILSGIRAKAPKRRPSLWRHPENKHFFSLNGLYKNGWIYAFLLANKIGEKDLID